MIEIRWGAAHPTEFVAAERTKHVITARFPLYFGAAHWTEAYVKVLSHCPLTELCFHVRFTTSEVAMPRLSALEANPVETFIAL